MICKWLVLTSFDHFPPFWLKNYAQSPSSQVHKIYQSTIGLMTMKSSSTDSSVEPCPLIFWYVWYVSMACDTPAGADSWRFLRIASANPIHLPGQLSSHEVWPSIANVQGSQRAPCLSHIMREKSHHPHGTAAIQKVTSGSGKSHQGRRITMAQPVSSILGDVVKSSRSIAHSDDFEGHKLIQTNSRQLILLDLNILYWCPASRDQIKPLLVQPQISCNANGLAVANPIGRAMI